MIAHEAGGAYRAAEPLSLKPSHCFRPTPRAMASEAGNWQPPGPLLVPTPTPQLKAYAPS